MDARVPQLMCAVSMAKGRMSAIQEVQLRLVKITTAMRQHGVTGESMEMLCGLADDLVKAHDGMASKVDQITTIIADLSEAVVKDA